MSKNSANFELDSTTDRANVREMKILENLKLFRPTANPDEVSFSSADGVSTAQNASPDTFGDRSDYTEQVAFLCFTPALISI